MKRFVRVGGMAFGLIAMTALGQSANGHLTVRLWANSAPDSQGSTPETMRVAPEGDHVITHVDQPSITVYLPNADKATGAAVVVIPGGGHSELWIDHEGHAVAEYLSSHGVAAFVLKYRLAREKGSRYTVEGTELGDVQRAIRTVRSRSEEWGLDTARIGVIGFSAGGELAALASTRSESASLLRAGELDAVILGNDLPDGPANHRYALECESCHRGDSGAGIFDADGALVGVYVGYFEWDSARLSVAEVLPAGATGTIW